MALDVLCGSTEKYRNAVSMKIQVRVIATALTIACALSTTASAAPLTLSTAGIAGVLDGKVGNSNPTTELGIAQQILDFIGLGVVAPAPCTKCYRTSTVFDYSATLSNPVQRGGLVVPAGYDYALAKYDGDNGGYVLFYIPTFGSTLPQYPANFWTTNPKKWAISHFTTFETVPDGGSTAALLGSAVFAVGYLRRRFSPRRRR